jgi:hypothetical protein
MGDGQDTIHSEMSLATFLLQYLTSPLSLRISRSSWYHRLSGLSHSQQSLLALHWLTSNAYPDLHKYSDPARRTSSSDGQVFLQTREVNSKPQFEPPEYHPKLSRLGRHFRPR